MSVLNPVGGKLRRFLVIIAVAVGCVLLPPASANADHGNYQNCGGVPDCRGNGIVHWRHTRGVPLDNNIQYADCMFTNRAAWVAAFQARVTAHTNQSWSWVSSVGLLHTTGCYGGAGSHACNPAPFTGIIQICSDNWTDLKAAGYAGLFEYSFVVDPGPEYHLVAARVRMEDNSNPDSISRLRTVGQEVGHGFGLGHTRDCSSIQSNLPYCSSPSSTPNFHDMAMIDYIYNGHQR